MNTKDSKAWPMTSILDFSSVSFIPLWNYAQIHTHTHIHTVICLIVLRMRNTCSAQYACASLNWIVAEWNIRVYVCTQWEHLNVYACAYSRTLLSLCTVCLCNHWFNKYIRCWVKLSQHRGAERKMLVTDLLARARALRSRDKTDNLAGSLFNTATDVTIHTCD